MKDLNIRHLINMYYEDGNFQIYTIKKGLYERFKKFHSLNYIFVIYDFESNNTYIELEFYENEYVLEFLNNPNSVQRLINSIKSSFIPIDMNLTTKILFNRKRVNFNRNNIDEVVFTNNFPKILYLKEGDI